MLLSPTAVKTFPPETRRAVDKDDSVVCLRPLTRGQPRVGDDA